MREIFSEYLQERKFSISPINVLYKEEFSGNATVSFSLKENDKTIEIKESKGNGLVDAIFSACSERYSLSYPNIKNLRVLDLDTRLKRKRKEDEGMSFDTNVEVILTVQSKNKSPTRFFHTSSSMLFSSYSLLLDVCEFYINCNLCFDRLKFLVEDARNRNRHDLTSKYKFDLSHIAETASCE